MVKINTHHNKRTNCRRILALNRRRMYMQHTIKYDSLTFSFECIASHFRFVFNNAGGIPNNKKLKLCVNHLLF